MKPANRRPRVFSESVYELSGRSCIECGDPAILFHGHTGRCVQCSKAVWHRAPSAAARYVEYVLESSNIPNIESESTMFFCGEVDEVHVDGWGRADFSGSAALYVSPDELEQRLAIEQQHDQATCLAFEPEKPPIANAAARRAEWRADVKESQRKRGWKT